MFQFNNLPDLLLAAQDSFRAPAQGPAFLSYSTSKQSWYLISLDDPNELADYHAELYGHGVFFLTKHSLERLPTDIDLDSLDTWLRTFPPSILLTNRLPYLDHVLLMYKGTLKFDNLSHGCASTA